MQLQTCDYTVLYRTGASHVKANVLFSIPHQQESEPETLAAISHAIIHTDNEGGQEPQESTWNTNPNIVAQQQQDEKLMEIISFIQDIILPNRKLEGPKARAEADTLRQDNNA